MAEEFKPTVKVTFDGDETVHFHVAKDGRGKASYVTPIEGLEDQYQGEFANAMRHGAGKYTFSNPDANNAYYEGQFMATHFEDPTVYESADAVPLPEYHGGLPHAQGLFVYPDGSHYSGEFENGKKHGHGTYTYANGDVYVGEFENDLKHGRGLYSVKAYPSSYEGTWVNGQLANGSSFHYHDGSSYTGDFHNNAPANNGKWTAASGSVTHGAHVTFSKAKDSEETYVAWRNNVSV